MFNKIFKFAITGLMALISQSQPGGRHLGLTVEFVILGLRQIDKPAVVAKENILELGISIKAHASDDQRLELPHEEIGEIEAPRLLFCHFSMALLARKKSIAMWARHALDTPMPQDFVQLPASTAIGIGGKHLIIVLAILENEPLDFRRDQLWPVVQRRWQTDQIDVAEAIYLRDRTNFTRQCATGQNQNFLTSCIHGIDHSAITGAFTCVDATRRC